MIQKISWIKLFDTDVHFKEYTLRQLSVSGKTICIARTPDGFFAFQDKCPHNGASLSKGFCDESFRVVCPLHRYPFDIRTGKALSGISYTLDTFPIELREDGYYIGIQQKKSPWWI